MRLRISCVHIMYYPILRYQVHRNSSNSIEVDTFKYDIVPSSVSIELLWEYSVLTPPIHLFTLESCCRTPVIWSGFRYWARVVFDVATRPAYPEALSLHHNWSHSGHQTSGTAQERE